MLDTLYFDVAANKISEAFCIGLNGDHSLRYVVIPKSIAVAVFLH